MKEEDLIRRKCGSKDPFRVPEGYFENFTAELMGKLPERTSRRTASTYRLPKFIWYAAAAVVCGLIFTGVLHHTHHIPQEGTSVYEMEANNIHDERDTELDEYLDYAMMSNQEIAQYLTEAY